MFYRKNLYLLLSPFQPSIDAAVAALLDLKSQYRNLTGVDVSGGGGGGRQKKDKGILFLQLCTIFWYILFLSSMQLAEMWNNCKYFTGAKDKPAEAKKPAPKEANGDSAANSDMKKQSKLVY